MIWVVVAGTVSDDWSKFTCEVQDLLVVCIFRGFGLRMLISNLSHRALVIRLPGRGVASFQRGSIRLRRKIILTML